MSQRAFRSVLFPPTAQSLLRLGLIVVAAALLAPARAMSAGADAPTWTEPSAEEVRRQALAWLAQQKPSEATLAKAEAIWSDQSEKPSGTELLTRLAVTFSLGDENARRLVERCSKPPGLLPPPPEDWLRQAPPLLANNLRLLYGRWLAHESLYDEAIAQLDTLRPADVVDPASLLFYRAAARYELLQREAGLKAIDELLAASQWSPKRYVATARLMRTDLESLKEDSLDHIARRMDDIRRRLDLGRAGQQVRQIEDGVIESLDKLIKKAEEQQQQQAAAAAAGAQNVRSMSPAPDSALLGGKGRGDVTRRDVGGKSGWGNLPPKQREEAMQQIGRDFPSHYRDIVEQYFRKLAGEQEERGAQAP